MGKQTRSFLTEDIIMLGALQKFFFDNFHFGKLIVKDMYAIFSSFQSIIFI